MYKRIEHFSESICTGCKYRAKCDDEIARFSAFQEIRDAIFPNAAAKYDDCGLWIKFDCEDNG